MALQLKCKFTGCIFTAIHDDKDIMLAQFGSHQKNHEATAVPSRVETSRVPKTERPKICSGSSEETSEMFLTRWKNYKKTSVVAVSVATGEHFECCDIELGDDIIKRNKALLEGTEQAVLTAIKKLAVIPIAIGVRRSELLQSKQDHGEGVCSFMRELKVKQICVATKYSALMVVKEILIIRMK